MSATLLTVTALASVRGDLLAASEQGVFRRTHEDSWQQLLPEPMPIATIVAAGGRIAVAGPGGIIASADGGTSWTAAEVQTSPTSYSCLELSPTFGSSGVALAGTLDDGIFRTSDHARTWRPANFGLSGLCVLDLAHTRSTAAIAATDTGLFRSHNQGRSWKAVATGVFTAVTTGDAAEVYAVCADGTVLHSMDDGATWRRTGAVREVGEPTVLHVERPRSVLAGTSSGALLRSTSQGATWEQVCVLDPVQALIMVGRSVYVATTTGLTSLEFTEGRGSSTRLALPWQVG